jgi:MerR family transcriptional regulator, mercuric resistance operon regulatory protein
MVQSQEVATLSIGKLAATAGVGVETIRFYQRRGLLETPTRDDGIRRYSDEDVRRLRFIRKAQAAGFKLEEIKELLALDAGSDRARARELAEQRLADLALRIAKLERARSALTLLARQCSASDAGPCPILDAFD